MKKKLIVANWKMNGSNQKVSDDLNTYRSHEFTNSENIIIALPFLYLYQACNISSRFKIASQDVSEFAGYGPYTGETSSKMLLDFNVKYTLIGHSERRNYFAETDMTLLKKLKSTIQNSIIPIFCIGEEQHQRSNGNYTQFLLNQLKLLTQLEITMDELCIAYEPIWSIGTGLTPTIPEISEIVNLIHSFVQKTLPHATISVLYGGSVTAMNIAEILQITDIDGVLVGGASLDADQFTAICAYA
ncbi:MAG: tpiA [Burkholderiales bacterium]|jgi:triosephosphate isomerase|nr:tpiA [Burkholderiales bacterium]